LFAAAFALIVFLYVRMVLFKTTTFDENIFTAVASCYSCQNSFVILLPFGKHALLIPLNLLIGFVIGTKMFARLHLALACCVVFKAFFVTVILRYWRCTGLYFPSGHAVIGIVLWFAYHVIWHEVKQKWLKYSYHLLSCLFLVSL
jgi:hypothetical protein